jgi:hypothetical protein
VVLWLTIIFGLIGELKFQKEADYCLGESRRYPAHGSFCGNSGAFGEVSIGSPSFSAISPIRDKSSTCSFIGNMAHFGVIARDSEVH